MKAVLISVAYWVVIAVVAVAVFLASNLAGPSGTPTYFKPTMNVFVIGAAVYAIGLIFFNRRKRL